MIPLCVCGHVRSDHLGLQPGMLRSESRCIGRNRFSSVDRCECPRYRPALVGRARTFEPDIVDYMEPPGLFEAVSRHSWNTSIDRANGRLPREVSLRA